MRILWLDQLDTNQDQDNPNLRVSKLSSKIDFIKLRMLLIPTKNLKSIELKFLWNFNQWKMKSLLNNINLRSINMLKLFRLKLIWMNYVEDLKILKRRIQRLKQKMMVSQIVRLQKRIKRKLFEDLKMMMILFLPKKK